MINFQKGDNYFDQLNGFSHKLDIWLTYVVHYDVSSVVHDFSSGYAPVNLHSSWSSFPDPSTTFELNLDPQICILGYVIPSYSRFLYF